MNALSPKPAGTPVPGPVPPRIVPPRPMPGRSARPEDRHLNAVRIWMHRNGTPLITTLAAVAGDPGAAAALRLIDDLRRARSWTPAFTRRLAHLRGLLLLEHLEDPHSPYPVTDAVLDCEDEDLICACCHQAERLQELIDGSRGLAVRA